MLSIIIPTFQEEKSIKNTLKVINEGLTKEMFEFEIIVVDDNSNDQTKKIISNFSKINSNIHFYLNDSSKGFGNSIVKGIEVVFVCTDVLLTARHPNDDYLAPWIGQWSVYRYGNCCNPKK